MKRLFTAKSGHSLWRDGSRLIIKDLSGPTPEQTDDGILYVDHKAKPVVDTKSGNVWLGLIRPDGRKCQTITSPEMYRYLRKMLWRNERAIPALDCPYCG